MLVTATKTGFFGFLRQAGDTFEVPEGEPESSWFKPVKQPEPAEEPVRLQRARKSAAPPAEEPLA